MFRAAGRLASLLTTLALLLSGCSAALEPDAEPSNTPRAARTPRQPLTGKSSIAEPNPGSKVPVAPDGTNPKAARVVALSVDGLNPAALTRFGANPLPNFTALLKAGASTLNARTSYEQTETLPNHAGMLTGRPITGSHGHQITFNKDPGPNVTISARAGTPIASVFDVVHAAKGATAMYASKPKFALYARSWPASLDKVVIDQDNDRLVATLVRDIMQAPARFTFLHLSAPDVAGHAHGFMGPRYLAAVQHIDDLLGRVLTATKASRTLSRHCYLIVTADHGGRGNGGHADATKPEDYRVPFIVAGPDVPAGADLYDVNPDYRDPGSSRPTYAGTQPVRNADLANLATRLLGLVPVPGSTLGRSPLL